ncbi:MAG: MFS transporter [Thermoplasmatales archaeon]
MGYSLKTYSVIISRALYALNWFDIAPGLVYISSDLNLRVVDLGIITTFFYLGLAIFQLVGGAMASRIGAKKVAFLGLMILGLGGIFSGISTTFPELAAARFLAGTGSALFFSPGLTVLREVSPPETYSFQVGLYNGAFNLGGGIGAFGWVFVDKVIGWRLGLITGGLMVVVAGVENAIVLGREKEERSEGRELASRMLDVVRDRVLWILPVATAVSMFAETVGGQFLVFYAENYLKLPKSEAGLTDGLFLLLGFIGGVVGGRMLSSERQRGWFTYFILILTGLSFSLISIAENFQTLLVFTSIAGFSLVSGFTVLYIESLKSINYRPIIPFALAFVNCLSIAIGSVSPYFFTFLLDKVNSHSGWLVLGVIGLALIPLLYFSRRNYNH